MKRFSGTPLFHLAFAVVSLLVHYWMLYNGMYGMEAAADVYKPFMGAIPDGGDKPFAAGPLVFAFYELISSLFDSPLTAFHAGSAILAATFTYAVLRLAFRLGSRAWLLLLIGLWSLISPLLHWMTLSHPHILLGLVFLLLLFLSLRNNNYVLVIIFLIHLVLTHHIIAVAAGVLTATSLIRSPGLKKASFF
jgi:hypothetical protein